MRLVQHQVSLVLTVTWLGYDFVLVLLRCVNATLAGLASLIYDSTLHDALLQNGSTLVANVQCMPIGKLVCRVCKRTRETLPVQTGELFSGFSATRTVSKEEEAFQPTNFTKPRQNRFDYL